MSGSTRAHWEAVYGTKALGEVSWYEPRAQKSIELIRATGIGLADPIIDVGSGASFLVDELLAGGYGDLTVLDISATVLQKLRDRLGRRSLAVTALQQDVLAFQPARRYALWHDRAVFHFLTDREDRDRYLRVLRQALRPEGHVIIATFGPSGPDRCSGLATMRYDAEALQTEMGRDFALLDASLVVHCTPWGAQQQFLYCRFRARRPEAWEA